MAGFEAFQRAWGDWADPPPLTVLFVDDDGRDLKSGLRIACVG